MKDFLSVGVMLGFLFILLLLSPFLTIWGLNTLFETEIEHSIWTYLAVWAILLVWKSGDARKKG